MWPFGRHAEASHEQEPTATHSHGESCPNAQSCGNTIVYRAVRDVVTPPDHNLGAPDLDKPTKTE